MQRDTAEPEQASKRQDDEMESKGGGLLSVVCPAYNEAKNLPLMYDRLKRVLANLDMDWEWIVVDDHSTDGTYGVISELAERDPRVRVIRFARNFGAHTAITCGIHSARGRCCIGLAADLQDPPEHIPELLGKWRSGADIVWAVRASREGEKASTLWLSKAYLWLMRKFVGMSEMPATGADFFLLDRKVIDAFCQFRESNVSILALIMWMGFRQEAIPYDKQARAHGRSGWGLKQKLKLVVDSVTSFSYTPIRLMSYFGFAIAALGFLYALIVVANALTGEPVPGWTSLMVIVLVVGGIQMLMMGVLGEYLWRALDEARRRPRYWIEATSRMEDQLARHQSSD